MTVGNLRPVMNRFTLAAYRVFSLVSLYAVLAGVLAYAAGAAFYATSRSWAAPVILSQVDKDSLDLTGRLLQTQGVIENLKLDVSRLRKEMTESQTHLSALLHLEPALDAAIERARVHKAQTGPSLVSLTDEKHLDNVKAEALLHKLDDLEDRADKELAAGLITKTDEVQLKTQLARERADLTDSKISALLLKDTIVEKMTPTASFLEILSKRTELRSAAANLQINIATSQRQIETEVSQIEHLEQAMDTARHTPYFLAVEGKTYLALVPYENQASAAEGAPVYDCLFSFVVCRRVGTVKRVFIGEQRASHPIFHTDLRGFLIQLDLSEQESAKSRTLFLGGKPLYL